MAPKSQAQAKSLIQFCPLGLSHSNPGSDKVSGSFFRRKKGVSQILFEMVVNSINRKMRCTKGGLGKRQAEFGKLVIFIELTLFVEENFKNICDTKIMQNLRKTSTKLMVNVFTTERSSSN